MEVELPLEDDVAVEDVEVGLLLEEDAVVEEEEDELPFEPNSDSMAENRSCMNFLNACRALWVESVEPVEFVDVVDPVVEAEVSSLATTSWRKVVRSGLLPEVLFVLFDELMPESAEIRLLKSDCSVLSVLFVEEVEEVDELFEPACNCEMSRSSPLEKLE